MFNAVLMMGALGLTVGIGLALASKVFYVYVDPKVAAIDDILPGANCGGCGMPGCGANAEAIVAGQAGPDSCVAAGDDVTEAIAAVMGVSVEAKEPDVALGGCSYGLSNSDVKFIYNGLNDCRAAALLGGGMKVCNIGCLGLGTCASQCPFDAIKMGSKGLPVVDNLKCTGCGTCERVCPKKIIKLSSVTRRILREYTTEDCTTPCQRACPAGIDICQYIKMVGEGNYGSAVQIVKERNPFPTVIGRICPRPCENACRRKHVDEPVAINALKRFASDYERGTGKRILPFKAPSTGKKIAIAGGGVHGLSVAFFASRLGHEATIFEATDKLGGLLNTAIAEYRLPKEVLSWDIEGVAEMGVNFEMCKMVGSDVNISDLLEDSFDAVFTASGGWDSRLTHIKFDLKSPIPGAFLLLDFLGKDFDGKLLAEVDVLCVGGEELLDDVVEQCKDFRIKKVTFLLLGDQHEDASLVKDYESDISVEIIRNSVITRLLGRGNNLTNVEFTSDIGSVRSLSTQVVLFSAGRFPEVIFSKPVDQTGHDTISDDWIGFFTNKQRPDVTCDASGDVLSDFNSAIMAIGAGRRAAADIHKSIYGKAVVLPDNILKTDSFIQNVYTVDDVVKLPRNVTSRVAIENLTNESSEVEKTFELEVARLEASRCLKCGLICYKRSSEI